MKILITGHTGYVGSNLLEKYINEEIYVFKRGTDPAIVREIQPDLIFHSAAEIYKEEEMFDSNVVLTNNLLREAEKAKAKAFVYIGSSSEYGRKNGPRAEGDRLSPETMYEATKAAGSLLTLASKIPTIVARPFSVFGKNEPLRRFIPIIYNCYKTGKQLSVGPGVHDFIYIDDFVNGLEMCADALLSGKVEKDIVNFGTGIQYTNEEVVLSFEHIAGQNLNWIRSDIKRPYDSTSWVCDTSYAREKYGYKPQVNLHQGLERYIKYREETNQKNT